MKQPRHQITDILATEVSDYRTLINQCIRLQNLNQPRYHPNHYVIELKPTNVWRLQNLNQPESKVAKLSGYRTLKAHVSDYRIKATEVLDDRF
jgi:hypothetical protein